MSRTTLAAEPHDYLLTRAELAALLSRAKVGSGHELFSIERILEDLDKEIARAGAS